MRAAERAGELFRRLFLTYFRILDLSYLVHVREQPEIQAKLAITLWRLAQVAENWQALKGIAGQILRRAFAGEAALQLGAALVSCEERFPQAGEHSVLYVVVENQAALHRPRLETLHRELCADLETVAPLKLEVLDRATHEALERLIAAGLIAPVSRASRPLHPVAETPSPLNTEEIARAKAHRELATRKLKMARLLTDGGMADEARAPLLDAAAALSRALAVEKRRPGPGAIEDAFQPPLAAAWGAPFATLRDFFSEPAADGAALIQALEALLNVADDCPF